MRKENEVPRDKAANASKSETNDAELSDVWRELLGIGSKESEATVETTPDSALPILSNDPWDALTHSRGIEVVDLKQINIRASDQEVEEILQVMQEAVEPEQSPKPKPRKQK